MSSSYCPTARRDLLAAVRGRLAPEAQRAFEEHLESCAECRALDLRERALNDALARLPERPAPAALERRLRASLSEAPAAVPEKRARPRRQPLALAGAALALAFALVVGVSIGSLRGGHDARLLVSEAVNDHLRVLYAQRAVEIESGGIHQVKPWFEGRLDFAPKLDFEGDAEFSLAGGSVGYFIDRKAAVFIFRHRLHVITLFEFRADGLPWPGSANDSAGRRGAALAQARGFQVIAFRDGDLGYAFVSDVDPATLQRFAALVAP
jgi:anti-sigma factor RsiW